MSFANSRNVTYQEIGRFVAAVRRAIASRQDGRKTVVYPFAGVDFVGHLWIDGHILRSMFPPDRHQVFFVQLPPSNRVHPRMAALATRGLEIVDKLDLPPEILFRVASTLFYDQPRFDFGDLHVVFGGASRVTTELYHLSHRDKPHRASMALTAEEEIEGAGLARQAGIDPGRPLVVLHVRSSGYNPAHTFNRFRDCDIARYVPAIEMLVRRGYSVLRIGDPSMPPVPLASPHVHDGPHLAVRDPLLDVWAVAHSAFMIHCSSGPTDIARAFGRPMLGINGHLSDPSGFESGHILLPKRVEEIDGGRPLDFAEIMRRRVNRVGHADHFTALGLRVVEAEAAAIEETCVEFIERLGKPPGPPSRFEQLNAMEHQLRQAAGGPLPEDRDWAMDRPNSRLATAYLDRHPDFLDRPPPPITERDTLLPFTASSSA